LDAQLDKLCAGRDLSDVARDWGLSKEDAARHLQPGSAVHFITYENDVQRVLAFDDTMIRSDGIALGTKPHPRHWGTLPRVLVAGSGEAVVYMMVKRSSTMPPAWEIARHPSLSPR
jgi:N-acyl-D-aspartate/D-glutamate deacylase